MNFEYWFDGLKVRTCRKFWAEAFRISPGRIQNFVDGAYLPGSTRDLMEDVNPATGAVHALVEEATEPDVDRSDLNNQA